MGIRISEMEEATTFTADDYVPIVTNGTNKKALGQKIKDFIAGFFVSKSGDTMTGDLNIDAAAPNVQIDTSNVTIDTTSDNHVTANTASGIEVRDSNDYYYGRLRTQATTAGAVTTYISARNRKTDGTSVINSINATVNKNGSMSYEISDPAAFRSAIGLYDTVNCVPFRVNSSNSKTFTFNNYYRSMILLGFAQGIGSVILGIITNSNSSISVRNLMTNSDFSSSALVFTYSGNALTISSTFSSDSVFTAILANLI